MKMNDRLLAVALLVATAQVAHATPTVEEANLLATLRKTYPSTTFTSVTASEVPGMYEVWMGPNVGFVSPKNPRYFIIGRMLDAKTATDITGPKLARAQQQPPRVVSDTTETPGQAIDTSKLPLQDALKVSHGTGARTLYVFSDPSCSFCRRLEGELARLPDVTIYTFVLPFQGRQLPTGILCSADPARSWSALMLNGDTSGLNPQASCPTPLDRNLALANQFRVNGTPTLFYADGTRTTGYVPVADIERRLASVAASSTQAAKAPVQERTP